MKTRSWILILSAVMIALIVLTAVVGRPTPRRTLARVYLDGACVWEVDLARLEGAAETTVETDTGFNRIEARPGGIRVAEADCPDQVCVRQGWLGGGRAPIVCLPHRLVIQLEEGVDEAPAEIDAISG